MRRQGQVPEREQALHTLAGKNDACGCAKSDHTSVIRNGGSAIRPSFSAFLDVLSRFAETTDKLVRRKSGSGRFGYLFFAESEELTTSLQLSRFRALISAFRGRAGRVGGVGSVGTTKRQGVCELRALQSNACSLPFMDPPRSSPISADELPRVRSPCSSRTSSG